MKVFYRTWALGVVALTLLAGCDGKTQFSKIRSLLLRDPIVITIAKDGAIAIDTGIDAVHWYCNISADDPTLCRGRADRQSTTLGFFDKAPLTFDNKTLMVYRSRGRIVAVQVTSETDDGRQMLERFGPLIENRYASSKDSLSRACGESDAAHAIESAEPNVNERHSSICADIGSTEITWRFSRFIDNSLPRHGLQLTIQAPGLPGPRSWWL